jgi:hypothetical protein
MEQILIKYLEMIAEDLTTEAKQKKEWGHFGNSLGRSESKKLLMFCAEMLMAIENNL